MNVTHCTHGRHARQILDVFNDAIATSTALFDYKPRTIESMDPWFQAKDAGRFPVIGVEDDGGRLLGFASYGPFRAWPAYKYSVEHSVYVHKDHRGKGLGRVLMTELVAAAQAQGRHVLVGGIEASNAPSLALHAALGFTHAGTLQQVAFKFGRWLDLSFHQLVLPTPALPHDD